MCVSITNPCACMRVYDVSTCYCPERYYLVFWPNETCYSEVPQYKVVEPKEPSAAEMS